MRFLSWDFREEEVPGFLCLGWFCCSVSLSESDDFSGPLHEAFGGILDLYSSLLEEPYVEWFVEGCYGIVFDYLFKAFGDGIEVRCFHDLDV